MYTLAHKTPYLLHLTSKHNHLSKGKADGVPEVAPQTTKSHKICIQ